MADIEMRVNGLDTVAAQLRDLPSKLARRALSASLHEAARPMLADAKSSAPTARKRTTAVNPGLLRRSVAMKGMKNPPGGAMGRGVVISVRRPTWRKYRAAKLTRKALRLAGHKVSASYFDPYYWYFLEHGWRPRGKGQSRKVPFLKPAFDRNYQTFITRFAVFIKAATAELWRSG